MRSAGKFPVTDLGRQLDEKTGPFMDTAAVLKNLDLFITSDTAVAPPGRSAGCAGVDGALDDARLALDDPSRGQPVVSDDADLPPECAHGLGPGVRADGRRVEGDGSRPSAYAVSDGADRAGRAHRQDHDP